MGDTDISPPSMAGLNSEVASVSAKIMVTSMVVLFFLVAFCFFLCLYTKWYWLRTEYPSVASWRRRTVRHTVVAQRRGLDHDTLKLLPVVVYDPEDFQQGLECSVCLSEISQGEKVRVLPKCDHGFHLECIDMWFTSHSTCPLCRNSVSSPKIESTDSNRELNEVVDTNSPLDSSLGSESDSDFTREVSTSSSRQRDELVIDIPRNLCDDFVTLPPSTNGNGEEEVKTPVVSRLSSLRRMLSRGKRVAPSSSTNTESL